MALSRLIYVSEPHFQSAAGSNIAQLASILAASRRNNEAAGITGALVYDELWFLQVLEGDRRSIWETFLRINEDERHDGCQLIEMVAIDERMFGNWWMGLAVRNALTATAFDRHFGGALQVAAMSSRDVLAFMRDLAKIGLNRDMHAAA